ncbi:hypothetical protein Ancab_006179 [Ancistrocladus abbreviatus]
MSCLASPWICGTSVGNSKLSRPSPFSISSSSSSSSCFRRVVCQTQFSAKDLKFVLHDALDSYAVDTTLARAARDSFSSQIQRLTTIERETSICINRHVDLGKTALYIAAEDESFGSHSSVPLLVEAFVERLDSLTMDYFPHGGSSLRAAPEVLLESIEKYLYTRKGFWRTNTGTQPEPLYLHTVLTHCCGSAALLCLIYSEILKMLRLWYIVDFDVEIFYPHDPHSLPTAYNKRKSKESDQPHIMTTEALLVEMLRNLKDAYWPFQHDQTRSLFLRAADAANCADRSSIAGESAFELASVKAAQNRLQRGVWTSVPSGDMKLALSACERLILLETDIKELRDYAVLLYHCGFYKESLDYLKLYQEMKQQQQLKSFIKVEEDAVEKLIVRLNLILMEEGWSKCSPPRSFLGIYSVPW